MKALEKSRVAEITLLHSEIGGYIKITIDKAIRAGELLTEQKAELAHGEWLPWIDKNLSFSESTALRYMKVWANRDRIKSVSVTDLTEAYKLLEEPKKKKRAPSKKPKPKPVQKPIIDDQEYERRKGEAFKEDDAPSLDEAFEDVKKLIIRQDNEEVFRDFDLAALIDELRRRILTIGDVTRRHQAVNQIIKAMRELAVECERLSTGN